MGKRQLSTLREHMLTISNKTNLTTPENESILATFLQIKRCMIASGTSKTLSKAKDSGFRCCFTLQTYLQCLILTHACFGEKDKS